MVAAVTKVEALRAAGVYITDTLGESSKCFHRENKFGPFLPTPG